MEWVILGYLGLTVFITVNLLVAWFDGGLRNALLRKLGWISDDTVAPDDIDRQLIISHGIIGTWLICPICTSGYFSLIVGTIFTLAAGLPPWFVILAFFSPQWIARKVIK